MGKAIETLDQFLNLDEKDLVFIDIETARVVEKLEGSHMEEAWHYKSRYQNELNRKTGKEYTSEEYFYEKAALYPPFARVVSIVLGRVEDNMAKLYSYSSYDEKELLENFDRDLQKVYGARPNTRLVHFNGIGFDTPMLDKRYMVNGIKGCRLVSEEKFEKPWTVSSIDLSKIWKGNSFYPDSLIAIASAFGLPSPKDTLDGSQVSDAFWNGRLSEIEKYCKKDVFTLIRIFRKMTFREDITEFVEMTEPVQDSPAPLLERIYNSGTITEELGIELEELLGKKKMTKVDKKHLEAILLAHYITETDRVADKKFKKEEIRDFLDNIQ